MTTNPWEHAARAFEPAPPPRFPTPGALAHHITPTTINTPALNLVDQALTTAWNTPDARLIISMAPQEGKALALNTPIATPTGWTTMGELKVGDQVFDRHGKPCNVTWVSPVWRNRPCYTVRTGDGEAVVADGAHEWPARLARRSSERLVDTVTLTRTRSKNAQITGPASLDMPAVELPLDPYVLGVWLGDGSSRGPTITCHPDDIAIRDRFAAVGWPLKKLSGRLAWSMVPEGWVNRGALYPSPAKAVLKSLGVLSNKHIPVAYLRASHEQRLALLQGLIDSDGHVLPKGQVEFVSINRNLAEQVRELVFTLGAKATVTAGRATINGRDCGPKYRVRFYLAGAAHLPRKADRCKDSAVAQRRYVWAEPAPSVPTVCIEVNSPDHTFLAGRSLLPTHNSVRVAKDFPIWALLQNPDLRIVVASYAQRLADRNGRTIRNTITAHPTLGLRVARDNGSVSEWSLDGHEGGVYSVGIGGALTGRPADCVGADTMIDCEHGRLTAAEAFRLGITRILAYDHRTGRAAWRDVEVARRIPGRPVLDVITASGRVLTCTPDHRVYTGRGYVPARDLRVGDALVALVATDRVPVRQPAGHPEDARPQGSPAGTESLLLAGMSGRGVLGGEPDAILPVRSAGPAQPSANLLHRVPARAAREDAPAEGVPSVSGRVPAEVLTDDVLLTSLRERRALAAHDRQGQLALQAGHELRSMVPIDAASDLGARRAPVRHLRGQSHDHVHPGHPDGGQVRAGDSPHQRGHRGQPSTEPHHALPDVPHGASQVEADTVAVVRSRGDETVSVYDFQVEGARNFFASGVLVHNCLIIDDPIKDRKEADSKVFRDNVWDWWTDTASARLAPGAPTILILTRWHHDDLAGRLLKSDTGWTLLNIPAQCEDPTTDPLGRQHGEYMASARKRTPTQWEQRKKAAGPATWASLYQGNPTPTVGNIFPRTAWRTWTTLPPLHDATVIQSWDMAFKATTTSDYVVGQVWAKVGADFYLLAQVRGRFDFPETLTQFRALTRRWPQAVAKLVEDKANGPAVIATLQHEIPGIIPVEPEGGKVARAHAAQPLVIAGNIYLPDEPWAADFIEEAAAFPNGANDDMVDAFTQAVNTLNLYATPYDDVRDHVPDGDPHAYLGGY